jgi:lysozyme family protein
MTAPWPLLPLGGVIDQARFIAWEFEGAKFGHRVVDHPRDPGGRTLSGLTLRTYSREYRRLPEPTLAPVAEFDALTLDEVVDVLIELFAMRTGIWQIGDPGLRLAVLDFAVHAGADDAVPALQRAIGTQADGQIGRQTLGVLQRLVQPRAAAVMVTTDRYAKAARRVLEAPQQSVPFLAGWFDRFRRVLLVTTALLALLVAVPVHAQDGGETPDGSMRSSMGSGESHVVATTGTRSVDGPWLPNPALTPGEVRPISLADICGTRWGTDRRFVSEAMKRHVFAAYGIAWSKRAAYEVDHKIPRSLGGADDVLNLWPQPWAGEWGARKKDRLEVKLGTLVCTGQISLGAAHSAIRENWVAAYRRFVEPLAASAGTSGIAPVTIAVLPRIALAPASARLTIHVERDADNRWLDVTIDGASYQRSSGRALEGADAARLFQFTYDSIPTGTYTVSAIVTSTHGRQVATSDLTVHGPEEGR